VCSANLIPQFLFQKSTQRTEGDILPPCQLGFRRFLAGIYIHTSAHIVAAPMAHYMAKNKSRFLFSHDAKYMSVYGLDKFLKNERTQMRFINTAGKQIAFHEPMNYYYRPKERENDCFYYFVSETIAISRKEATKLQVEFYEFLEEHPLHEVSVLTNRKRFCIPSFAWNWLGSTKKFSAPLTTIVDNTSIEYKEKEEHAYRFMLLFLPLRTDDDLKIDGSYQKGWLKALEHGRFSEEMIEIADNIQTIHNSLESSIPSNCLTLVTGVDGIPEDPEENNFEHSTTGDMLASIGELFASTNGEKIMTEDSKEINPKYISKFSKILFPMVESEEEQATGIILESVIQHQESEDTNNFAINGNYNTERFCTNVSELNSLYSQRIVRRDDATSDILDINKKRTIKATGSCESIEFWGKNANLDTEQQMAFEILAASYVLTFYKEATSSHGMNHDDLNYITRIRDLHTLSRRSVTEFKPLRLFVTGPAGAGKCKELFYRCCLQ
jgi:hypothetical protein